MSSHKRVSAETVRVLTAALGAARSKQSSELEGLESEVQVCHDSMSGRN